MTFADEKWLSLPDREPKPRARGLTVVLDNGAPTAYFKDVIESAAPWVDLVKFGWGTALVSPGLDDKIRCLQDAGLDWFFGGTLFEKFYVQRRVDRYHDYLRRHGCRYVEISNGTAGLSNAEKARFIREFSREFRVLSEVGYKDAERSAAMHPAMWIRCIEEDLAAGAHYTITEARESGTGGICRADGELRFGLIEEIVDSGLDLDRLVFEAPNQALQTYFVKRMGANVNLANVPLGQVVSLETLRLGLRSDTLLWSEGAEGAWGPEVVRVGGDRDEE